MDGSLVGHKGHGRSADARARGGAEDGPGKVRLLIL